jgi:hypothetical protein
VWVWVCGRGVSVEVHLRGLADPLFHRCQPDLFVVSWGMWCSCGQGTTPFTCHAPTPPSRTHIHDHTHCAVLIRTALGTHPFCPACTVHLVTPPLPTHPLSTTSRYTRDDDTVETTSPWVVLNEFERSTSVESETEATDVKTLLLQQNNENGYE